MSGPVKFAKVYNHFAFVTFESVETREAVLEAGQDQLTLWKGKKLKVAAARRKEIKTRTWVRSKSQGIDRGVQAVDFPVPELQQYQLTPTDLQVNQPRTRGRSWNGSSASSHQQLHRGTAALQPPIHHQLHS